MENNLPQAEHLNGSAIEPSTTVSQESIVPKIKKSIGKKRILQSAMPSKGLQEVLSVPKNMYKKLKQEVVPLETISTLIGIKQKSSNFMDYLNAAEAYGLVQKGDNGYSVSEIGRKIVAPAIDGEDREAIKQAIFTPTLLSRIYSDFNKRPIPGDDIFKNALEITYGVPEEKVDRTKEIILENARLAGILSEDNGVEYLIINSQTLSSPIKAIKSEMQEPDEVEDVRPVDVNIIGGSDFENTCFVISPIGVDDSEERKHANMMLKHLITPVATELGIKIVRADNIDKSGIITQQILEYIARAPYCITDLSFGNPNVFYELGVRHVCQLPTVQIIRKEDKIPFDVAQGRTIVIDTTNVYTIMDRFESARKELREHLLKMVKQKGKEMADDNPIRIYLPELKVSFPK